jgi:hypothetical protein
VVGGRVVSNEDAIAAFRHTGRHFGIYRSAADATAAGQALHQSEARRVMAGGQSSDELAAKYGGVSSDELASKYGGTVEEEAPAKPASSGLGIGDQILGGLGQAVGLPPGLATDVVKGLIKSGLSTIQGGGELIRQIPGVGKALSVADVTLPKPINLEPSNPTQALAKGAGDIGQFFLPAADIEKAVALVPKAAKVTRALVRAGLEGASAAGISSAQAGSTEGAGATGAAAAGLSLVVPPVVEKGAELLGGAFGKRMGQKMVGEVLLPAGRSKEIRALGKEAAAVAPRLAEEPGMGAWSRQELQAKVSNKVEDVADKLEAAHGRYNQDELFDWEPVVADLEAKRAKLVAESAPDTEATGAQLEKLGVSRPPAAPPMDTRFKDLPPAYKREMRRMLQEMENFQFTPSLRAHVTNYPGGKIRAAFGEGTEIGITADTSFEGMQGEAGAPVFHDILRGRSGTRRQVEGALDRYINEGVVPNPLTKRALEVAEARVIGKTRARGFSAPSLPEEAGYVSGEEAGKIGYDVIPAAVRPRVEMIDQAIADIRQLGPAATYKAIQQIRKGYDIPATPLYRKMIGADPQAYTRAMLESKGAADVTGSIRDGLAAARPETAPLNRELHFWKTIEDLQDRTEEIERVRPKVGRAMLAAATGGAVGAGLGHGVAGLVLGPVIDAALHAGPTFKVQAGRLLVRLNRAVSSGSGAEAAAVVRQLQRLAVAAGASGRRSSSSGSEEE